MSYAIVGFGNIGQSLARAFARKGIEVVVAATRPPEALASIAESIGSTVIPGSLDDALGADVVLLAVPYWSHRDVARALSNWQGKTVIDVTNAYGVPPAELGELPSSAVVAQAFAGARLVKGFNHLPAPVLGQDPATAGGRRVVFLSSDHQTAVVEVSRLAERLGFAPINLGGLSEGGLLVQARGNHWAQLVFQDLVKFA